MIQEDYVTFEQAKKLKELGFPQNIEKHNHNWTSKDGMFGGPYESTCIMIPTLSLVQKWFREEKKLYICIEITSKHNWIVYVIDMIKNESCYEFIYDTYDVALSAGIDKCMELLKKSIDSNM